MRASLRWILVVIAAAAIVLVSYWLLMPSRPQLFPDDHGRSDIAKLGLGQAAYYQCVVDWAEANASELRIGNDWILERGTRDFGRVLGPDAWGIHIDSARPLYDVDAAFVEGTWLAELGPTPYGSYEFTLPCSTP